MENENGMQTAVEIGETLIEKTLRHDAIQETIDDLRDMARDLEIMNGNGVIIYTLKFTARKLERLLADEISDEFEPEPWEGGEVEPDPE